MAKKGKKKKGAKLREKQLEKERKALELEKKRLRKEKKRLEKEKEKLALKKENPTGGDASGLIESLSEKVGVTPGMVATVMAALGEECRRMAEAEEEEGRSVRPASPSSSRSIANGPPAGRSPFRGIKSGSGRALFRPLAKVDER